MGIYPAQTAFMRLIGEQADVFPGYERPPAEYMGATTRPVIKAAEEVMRLPTARTLTMMMQEPWDCTDWYLSDPGDDPNNFKYQQTRFVGWDKKVADYDNSEKQDGSGSPFPLYKDGTSRWDRVGVTAPKERPVTVVVSWNVLPYADINPDGPGGEIGSGTSLGASGQVMWASVGGPDKGMFGTGPLALSFVGVPGINATAWPAGTHASLVVPAGSTYEIGLNFVAGIDTSYLGGVGRESQVVRTQILGNFESFGAQFGVTGGIPPAYFQGFSVIPEVGPTQFVNDSFSMMTVTTY